MPLSISHFKALLSIVLLPIFLMAAEEDPFRLSPSDFVFDGTLDPLDDPQLIDFLKRNSGDRPENCPIKATGKSELIQKLNAIKVGLMFGPCRERHQDLVNGLSGVIQNISTNMKANSALLGTPTMGAWTPMAQQQTANLNRDMQKLTEDSDCLSDLKAKGIVSIVADVAISMGLMSMLIPSANSFVIGISVATFGSTLKVLAGLFQSVFNWDIQRDRQQFFDLNCAYYELRHELDESGFYDLHDKNVEPRVALANSIYTRLDVHRQRVYAALKRAEEGITAKLNAYTNYRDHRAMIEVLTSIQGAVTLLKSPEGEENNKEGAMTLEQRAKAVYQIALMKDKVVQYLASEPDVLGNTLLKDLLNKFSYENVPELNRMPMAEFIVGYQKPLLVHLTEFLAILEARQEAALNDFSNLSSVDPERTNGRIVDQFKEIKNHIVEKMEYNISRLLRRIGILQSIKEKANLNAYENGSHVAFDIATEDKQIQNMIFGPRGWAFLNYLLSDMNYNIRSFRTTYRDWANRYNSYKNPLTEEQKDNLCLDALEMRKQWERANNGLKTASNFIETNKDLFHTSTPFFRYFALIFPVDMSDQFLLNANLKALQRLNAYLKPDGSTSAHEERLIGLPYYYTPKNIGLIGMIIARQLPKRTKIEDFIREAPCDSKNQIIDLSRTTLVSAHPEQRSIKLSL